MSTRDPYAPLFVAYWYWETLDRCNIPLLHVSPVTLISSGQCLELVMSEGEWGGTAIQRLGQHLTSEEQVGIATWTSRIALGCEVIMMTTTEAWGLPMTRDSVRLSYDDLVASPPLRDRECPQQWGDPRDI
ncbi:hypothetical protein JOM56_000835 [Amanita muscaria]